MPSKDQPTLTTMLIALKLGDEEVLCDEVCHILSDRYGDAGRRAISDALFAKNGGTFPPDFSSRCEACGKHISKEDAAAVEEALREAGKAEKMPDESLADLYVCGFKKEAMCYAYKNYHHYVASIINRNYPTFAQNNWDSLYQSGCIGLISALEKYSPDKGKFTTYSKYSIIHEITAQLHFANNSITVYFNGIQKKIRSAMQDLKQNDLPITIASVSTATGLRPEIVKRELDYIEATNFYYLDVDNNTEKASVYADGPDALLEQKQEKAALQAAVNKLSETGREIIRLKYGERKTNAEIGKILGMTTGTVKVEYQKALRALRKDRKLSEMFPTYKSAAERDMEKYRMSPIPKMSDINAEMDDIGNLLGAGAEEESMMGSLSLEQPIRKTEKTADSAGNESQHGEDNNTLGNVVILAQAAAGEG